MNRDFLSYRGGNGGYEYQNQEGFDTGEGLDQQESYGGPTVAVDQEEAEQDDDDAAWEDEMDAEEDDEENEGIDEEEWEGAGQQNGYNSETGEMMADEEGDEYEGPDGEGIEEDYGEEKEVTEEEFLQYQINTLTNFDHFYENEEQATGDVSTSTQDYVLERQDELFDELDQIESPLEDLYPAGLNDDLKTADFLHDGRKRLPFRNERRKEIEGDLEETREKLQDYSSFINDSENLERLAEENKNMDGVTELDEVLMNFDGLMEDFNEWYDGYWAVPTKTLQRGTLLVRSVMVGSYADCNEAMEKQYDVVNHITNPGMDIRPYLGRQLEEPVESLTEHLNKVDIDVEPLKKYDKFVKIMGEDAGRKDKKTLDMHSDTRTTEMDADDYYRMREMERIDNEVAEQYEQETEDIARKQGVDPANVFWGPHQDELDEAEKQRELTPVEVDDLIQESKEGTNNMTEAQNKEWRQNLLNLRRILKEQRRIRTEPKSSSQLEGVQEVVTQQGQDDVDQQEQDDITYSEQNGITQYEQDDVAQQDQEVDEDSEWKIIDRKIGGRGRQLTQEEQDEYNALIKLGRYQQYYRQLYEQVLPTQELMVPEVGFDKFQHLPPNSIFNKYDRNYQIFDQDTGIDTPDKFPSDKHLSRYDDALEDFEKEYFLQRQQNNQAMIDQIVKLDPDRFDDVQFDDKEEFTEEEFRELAKQKKDYQIIEVIKEPNLIEDDDESSDTESEPADQKFNLDDDDDDIIDVKSARAKATGGPRGRLPPGKDKLDEGELDIDAEGEFDDISVPDYDVDKGNDDVVQQEEDDSEFLQQQASSQRKKKGRPPKSKATVGEAPKQTRRRKGQEVEDDPSESNQQMEVRGQDMESRDEIGQEQVEVQQEKQSLLERWINVRDRLKETVPFEVKQEILARGDRDAIYDQMLDVQITGEKGTPEEYESAIVQEIYDECIQMAHYEMQNKEAMLNFADRLKSEMERATASNDSILNNGQDYYAPIMRNQNVDFCATELVESAYDFKDSNQIDTPMNIIKQIVLAVGPEDPSRPDNISDKLNKQDIQQKLQEFRQKENQLLENYQYTLQVDKQNQQIDNIENSPMHTINQNGTISQDQIKQQEDNNQEIEPDDMINPNKFIEQQEREAFKKVQKEFLQQNQNSNSDNKNSNGSAESIRDEKLKELKIFYQEQMAQEFDQADSVVQEYAERRDEPIEPFDDRQIQVDERVINHVTQRFESGEDPANIDLEGDYLNPDSEMIKNLPENARITRVYEGVYEDGEDRTPMKYEEDVSREEFLAQVEEDKIKQAVPLIENIEMTPKDFLDMGHVVQNVLRLNERQDHLYFVPQVLMILNNVDGTTAAVHLNKIQEETLKDLWTEDVKLPDYMDQLPVYHGGSSGKEYGLICLHRYPELGGETEVVTGDICMNGLEHAYDKLEEGVVHPLDFKFYHGVEIFDTDELLQAIHLGWYYVAQAGPDIIWQDSEVYKEDLLWYDIMKLMGGHFRLIGEEVEEQMAVQNEVFQTRYYNEMKQYFHIRDLQEFYVFMANQLMLAQSQLPGELEKDPRTAEREEEEEEEKEQYTGQLDQDEYNDLENIEDDDVEDDYDEDEEDIQDEDRGLYDLYGDDQDDYNYDEDMDDEIADEIIEPSVEDIEEEPPLIKPLSAEKSPQAQAENEGVIDVEGQNLDEDEGEEEEVDEDINEPDIDENEDVGGVDDVEDDVDDNVDDDVEIDDIDEEPVGEEDEELEERDEDIDIEDDTLDTDEADIEDDTDPDMFES